LTTVRPRSGFITYPAFDKLRPNGRKTVRGDAELVEASNHEPEVMKLLLVKRSEEDYDDRNENG